MRRSRDRRSVAIAARQDAVVDLLRLSAALIAFGFAVVLGLPS